MKIQVMVISVVTLCSDLLVYQCSTFDLKMELARLSETMVTYQVTRRCRNSEDQDLNLHRPGNFKSREW